ncbi:vitamin B6 photo-protection and homoeostasis-domain-containing protein [Elsinoe ampelina]|uniref:Vitamin B6 photo-protection and homoeostasis-domain-containing protein n=1 Tax=Elsinoe ampelina TaxID=302913 RepID=A0A6A6GD97_9PEZI|nr:vitamin B6 photo-protection and homoeostasis-domain-containing protein [Elsinoe ampelina]
MASLLPRIVSTDEAGNILATFVPRDATKRDGKSTDDQVRVDVIRPPSTLLSLPTRLLHLFLPTGYPHSVTPDYLPYQTYDSLQAFTSSIASLLSSRAVLSTLGVGDASASPTLAILLSILQDSLGRVTTILFAHRLGNALEPECKLYRLAADVFNDVAMVLECLSPAFPRTGRVAVLAGASALKALCGVAAGSSKASLSAHFARWGNLAELNAKDSSQETVISLVGMLVGGAVVGYVREGVATWVVLLGLLGAHLWLNWMARAGVVFGGWTEGGRVLGPEEVRGRERVFERDGVVRGLNGRVLGWASIGLSFDEFLGRVGMPRGQGQHAFDIGRSVIDGIGSGNEGSQRRYLIHLDIGSRHCFIALEKSSVVRDQLHAWFTAYRALQLLGRGIPVEYGDGNQEVKGKSMTDANGLVGQATASGLLRAAQEYVDGEFPTLMSRLEEAGWDLKTGALETRRGIRFARV